MRKRSFLFTGQFWFYKDLARLCVPYALFANHIVCTILYLLPHNPMTNYYGSYVNAYMFPFFSQNWNLFAPEPSTDRVRLLVRCKKYNWSQWHDPGKKILDKHHKSRILGYGKILYVYRNMARDLISTSSQLSDSYKCFNNDKVCLEKFFPILKKTEAWRQASRLAKFTCYSIIEGARYYQISLVVEQVRSYSKRKENDVWGDVAQIRLPKEKI